MKRSGTQEATESRTLEGVAIAVAALFAAHAFGAELDLVRLAFGLLLGF